MITASVLKGLNKSSLITWFSIIEFILEKVLFLLLLFPLLSPNSLAALYRYNLWNFNALLLADLSISTNTKLLSGVPEKILTKIQILFFEDMY